MWVHPIETLLTPAAAGPTAGGGEAPIAAGDSPYATIAADPELSTFRTAIETAGLVSKLDGTDPNNEFTVFAPTNTALEGGTLSQITDQQEASLAVRYYVLSGIIGPNELAGIASSTGTVNTTSNNAPLAISGDATTGFLLKQRGQL